MLRYSIDRYRDIIESSFFLHVGGKGCQQNFHDVALHPRMNDRDCRRFKMLLDILHRVLMEAERNAMRKVIDIAAESRMTVAYIAMLSDETFVRIIGKAKRGLPVRRGEAEVDGIVIGRIC